MRGGASRLIGFFLVTRWQLLNQRVMDLSFFFSIWSDCLEIRQVEAGFVHYIVEGTDEEIHQENKMKGEEAREDRDIVEHGNSLP